MSKFVKKKKIIRSIRDEKISIIREKYLFLSILLVNLYLQYTTRLYNDVITYFRVRYITKLGKGGIQSLVDSNH
uniref:Uncharacterized protein n=1 Tax=Lepeophtheirus salmonis TaxID=72036 RepID=A0A0K2U7P4_LEPSM